MRVVVIGAGHNGLIAAVHLARAGVDVTVLEHAPRPGGASSSTAATLPGFVHDHCAGFVPLAAASPAILELELERHGLSWITPPTPMAHPFEDGSAIALHRDLDATVASLGAPGAPWRSLVERTRPVAGSIVRTILSPLPPVRAPARVALALRRDGLELARQCLASAEGLGLELFAGDRRATAWLAGSAMHSGLPPDTAGSGAFGLLLQLLGHTVSWPLPRGGMQQLADTLARLVADAGGAVRCDARVEHVLVRSGRVGGVRLAGGEELACDAVVSTLSARPLAGLLPDGALAGRLERRLRSWRHASGAFKIDYALSGPVPWTAAEAREAAVVHVAGELHDLAAGMQATGRGAVPGRPALVVGQQSLLDPSRAPAGRHTLYVYGHVPQALDVPEDEVAARIEAQLERFAPGWSRLVLGRAVRGPGQTERENPSLVGGDLAGGSYELDQQLIFRPAPELCRYRTPLRGLYVAGASVHPGGAVQGMSGRSAARALLADRRRGALLRRLRPARAPRSPSPPAAAAR
jgi:phytoene dehydrogenase-like protein